MEMAAAGVMSNIWSDRVRVGFLDAATQNIARNQVLLLEHHQKWFNKFNHSVVEQVGNCWVANQYGIVCLAQWSASSGQIRHANSGHWTSAALSMKNIYRQSYGIHHGD